MQPSPSAQSSAQVKSSTSGRQSRMRCRQAWLGGELVSGTAHRLDQVEAELRPEPPDADIDDIGTGVEVVTPDGREQLVLAHRLAGVLPQRPQQQELQPGEGDRPAADVGL